MNDQATINGPIPWRMLQVMAWVEWMQPLLYCLLAVALICLLLKLMDLVLLCWKEFHPASSLEKTELHKVRAPVSVHQFIQPILMVVAMLCGAGQAYPQSLYTSIRDGNLQHVKILLAQGANINTQDADGTSPLMYAVINAEADCVKLLLDKGADPNLSNKAGATALMWAVNDLKKVQLLLAKGANVNVASKEEESPLLIALRLPNPMPVVQALLAKGADVNQADKDGFTPLIRAGFSGNLKLVQMLIAKGADPKAKSKEGLTHLKAIMFSNKLLAVKWVLEQGFEVNDPKESFLFMSAMNGDLVLTRLLLDKGATPNPVDEDGFTPLMVAVLTEGSSLEMVKLLLEKGADPKVKTKDGWTALTFAQRKGWTEAIALLTKAGVTE